MYYSIMFNSEPSIKFFILYILFASFRLGKKVLHNLYNNYLSLVE